MSRPTGLKGQPASFFNDFTASLSQDFNLEGLSQAGFLYTGLWVASSPCMVPRDHAAGEMIPVALRDGCQLCRLTLATAGKMRVRKGRIVGLPNSVLKAWLAFAFGVRACILFPKGLYLYLGRFDGSGFGLGGLTLASHLLR